MSNLGARASGEPPLVPWSNDSQAGRHRARAHASTASLRQELDEPAGGTGGCRPARPARFPLGIGPQGVLLERGFDAVRISGSGELADEGGELADVDEERLGALRSRRTLRTVTALDQGPRARARPRQLRDGGQPGDAGLGARGPLADADPAGARGVDRRLRARAPPQGAGGALAALGGVTGGCRSLAALRAGRRSWRWRARPPSRPRRRWRRTSTRWTRPRCWCSRPWPARPPRCGRPRASSSCAPTRRSPTAPPPAPPAPPAWRSASPLLLLWVGQPVRRARAGAGAPPLAAGHARRPGAAARAARLALVAAGLLLPALVALYYLVSLSLDPLSRRLVPAAAGDRRPRGPRDRRARLRAARAS